MKYIVYKTINLINNYIYIGVHKTLDPNIFDYYLGNGVYSNRPDTYKYGKTRFQQAIIEFGVNNFRRETLAVFDTDEEAYNLEEELVNERFLSRSDVYNMILGGRINRCYGITVYMYNNNGLYCDKFNSYEDAAKYLNVQASSIRRAVLYKYCIKDYYFSTIKIDELDLSEFNNIKKIAIYMYSKDGNYIQEFDSYNNAAKVINGSAANVRKSCILGYLVQDQYYFSYIKEKTFDKAKLIQIKTRKVYQYSGQGVFIKEYISQQEAEKENIGSNITRAIKSKTLCENKFYWGLEKLEYYNKSSRKIRKVVQLDDEGKVLKTWDSARKCAKEVGSAVQNVLNNKYKKHKGYIYKYIE